MALFDRATAWLLAHKILLPGVTTLERFVVSVRARVEARLYQLLTRGITVQQKDQLQRLLLVPEGDRVSLLDQIRSGRRASAVRRFARPSKKPMPRFTAAARPALISGGWGPLARCCCSSRKERSPRTLAIAACTACAATGTNN